MASLVPFDPFTQDFNLRLGDGTPLSISIADVDELFLYSIQISINYAAQLGASSILLIALLVLTKPDKRQSAVFILNSLALVLNIIRNVLQCLYFTSAFLKTYAHFGRDYSRVPRSAYATSIAATVLAVLLLICVEVSLVLQVRVVSFLLVPVYRRAIFTISAVIALLAVGFRLALCVENSRFIISLDPPSSLNWLESASNITTSISICWFCAAFVTKLGFALHERRQLGLKRFGPMQIIFIMGCQTLIVPGISHISTRIKLWIHANRVVPFPPAIFSLLQYVAHIPSMSSNALTVVVLFLPLSSLWASASPGIHNSLNPDTTARRRRKFFGRFPFASGGTFINDKILDSPSSIHDTVMSGESTILSPLKTTETSIYADRNA